MANPEIKLFNKLVDVHWVTADQWYTWYPVQQPYNFQLANMLPGFHNASDCEDLFQNGWNRLPMSGVIHISPDRLCPFPIPQEGFVSLEDAIAKGHWWDGAWSPFDYSVSPDPKHYPDMWTITGVTPPKHTDTRAVKNRIAAQVALTWQRMFNTTSAAYNGLMSGCVGEIPEGGTKFGRPSTAFKVPLGDPSVPPHGVGDGTYIGGIPAGFWFSGGSMWIGQPAWAKMYMVGQLDSKKWDTSDPYSPHKR